MPQFSELPVRLLKPDAKLPTYATPGSAGMDLYAYLPDRDVTLHFGDRAIIPTGIAVAIPYGLEGQIRPRSGLAAKHGVTVINAPGTVDPDYRGEIKVALVCLRRDGGHFTIKHGDRIAQMILSGFARIPFNVVDALPGTERGEGGFGSTGQ
jgi:dUTP pyrophosphatase